MFERVLTTVLSVFKACGSGREEASPFPCCPVNREVRERKPRQQKTYFQSSAIPSSQTPRAIKIVTVATFNLNPSLVIWDAFNQVDTLCMYVYTCV